MLKGGNKLRAFFRIVAQPVQQLREAPFGRIHSAAPLNRRKLFAMRRFRDLRGFSFGTVIAPKIIFVERLKIFPNGNHRRTGGVHGQRLHLIAGYARFPHCLARSARQSAHLVVVRLRGVFRIFAFAVQRIFRKCGREQASFAVHNGNANA